MKVFIAIILSVVVLQALAKPTLEVEPALADPAHIVSPRSERVDKFREDVETWFVRFQEFYDEKNDQARRYRLAHVEQITTIYNHLMTVFGDEIAAVRQVENGLDDLTNARVASVGSVNPCIQEVMNEREENSVIVGAVIQECATFANTTLSAELLNVFYPAFAAVQQQTSSIPLATLDILSRGNAMADETQMVEYMQALFEVKDFQWKQAASQLLRWEKARWETDGLFLVDEMAQCLSGATFDFTSKAASLEAKVRTC